ncbi:MAG TPA: hypothetical protein VGR71_07730 [Nitrospira sp.]|nr:hypothetical protein [Nitrospira sp.]
MATTVMEDVLQAFEITREEEIAAPIQVVFETILEQMGALNSTPEKPMPMVLVDQGWNQLIGRIRAAAAERGSRKPCAPSV